MSKVDWNKFRVIEKWTSLDPGNPNAFAKEQEYIQLLAALILKAFRRSKLAKAKQLKQSTSDAGQGTGT